MNRMPIISKSISLSLSWVSVSSWVGEEVDRSEEEDEGFDDIDVVELHYLLYLSIF